MMSEFKHNLIKAKLPNIILKATFERPVHGYYFINMIRKKTGCYFGASTIYPLLIKMEKDGLITSAWNTTLERPRKEYNITEKGKRELQAEDADLSMISTKFDIPLVVKS